MEVTFTYFLYSIGASLYILVVLSVGINKLGEVFTFAISAFTKFWNLLFMFLNLMDFIISSTYFSNTSCFESTKLETLLPPHLYYVIKNFEKTEF